MNIDNKLINGIRKLANTEQSTLCKVSVDSKLCEIIKDKFYKSSGKIINNILTRTIDYNWKSDENIILVDELEESDNASCFRMLIAANIIDELHEMYQHLNYSSNKLISLVIETYRQSIIDQEEDFDEEEYEETVDEEEDDYVEESKAENTNSSQFLGTN